MDVARHAPRGIDVDQQVRQFGLVEDPAPQCLFDATFRAELRHENDEPARREAWLRDQYQHPEEHSHTLAEVQGWFAENGVEYLRAYPSAVLDDEPEELFAPAPDNWRPEGWLAQMGWIWTLGHEGGLFFTVGRRIGPDPAVRQ